MNTTPTPQPTRGTPRPKRAPEILDALAERIRALRTAGTSWRQICRDTGEEMTSAKRLFRRTIGAAQARRPALTVPPRMKKPAVTIPFPTAEERARRQIDAGRVITALATCRSLP